MHLAKISRLRLPISCRVPSNYKVALRVKHTKIKMTRPRICLFVSFLSLWLKLSRGFVLHSFVGIRPFHQVGVSSNYRPSLHVRCSMAVDKKSWKDLHEFNIALDKLAEQSGSFNQPVIVKAAECQSSWEDQVNNPSATPRPDTISFNTVLKAWNRCCHALVDIDRNPHRHRNFDVSHSVPVYTPRDAAERATTLLLRQIEIDDEEAKPDAASFNVVIGKRRGDSRADCVSRYQCLSSTSKLQLIAFRSSHYFGLDFGFASCSHRLFHQRFFVCLFLALD